MSSEEKNAASPVTDLQVEFTARAEAVGAEVLSASSAELPRVLEEHLGPLASSGVGIAAEVLQCFPDLDALIRPGTPWPAVAVTRGVFGIAATGSIVLADRENETRRLGLLCRRHVVLLPALIMPDLNAAVPFLRARAESRTRPYVSFVTGPSRTSDIERVLTIGVHGPAELAIILIQDWREIDA